MRLEMHWSANYSNVSDDRLGLFLEFPSHLYQGHPIDRFALEITRDNYAAASAFVKLQTDNLANPGPNALLHVLRDNHPALAERVEFCNTYKPWEKGEKLRYREYFK